MAFHGPYHGSVTLTCSPLPNHHHSQLSKVVSMRKNHTLKAYGGVEIKLHAFFAAAQDGG
jgi:hypothetical protein